MYGQATTKTGRWGCNRHSRPLPPHLGQHPGVPHDHQPVPRARECHVEPPRLPEEPDPLPVVGSHARQHHVVLLPALEGIHGRHLHGLVQLLAQGPRPLHDRLHVRPLPVVGRDDADLGRVHPVHQEPRHHLLHRLRLGAVQVRRAAAAQLLRPQRHQEHHGRGRAWGSGVGWGGSCFCMRRGNCAALCAPRWNDPVHASVLKHVAPFPRSSCACRLWPRRLSPGHGKSTSGRVRCASETPFCSVPS